MVATLSGVSLIGSVSYSACDKTHVGVCNSSSGYLCVRIVLLHPSNGASSSRGASQSRVSMACKRSMDWNRQEETFIFHRWRDSGQLGKVEEVRVCWGRRWAGYQSWIPRCTGNHWDSWLMCWQNMFDAHSPHTCNWIIDVLWKPNIVQGILDSTRHRTRDG